MTELIRTEQTSIGEVCSAKDLYEGLELHSAHWAKWAKRNIEGSKHYKQGEDWAIHPLGENPSAGGRPTKDYILSVRFAKHLAMMANTEKSVEYRDYFLRLEEYTTKQIQPIHPQLPDFTDPVAAARAWADQAEEAQRQRQIAEERKEQLAIAAPKLETYETWSQAENAIMMSELAKTLAIPGMGRNNLFAFLREHGILNVRNEPFQHVVNKGWFKLKIGAYALPDGTTRQSTTTTVLPAGYEGVHKLLAKHGFTHSQ